MTLDHVATAVDGDARPLALPGAAQAQHPILRLPVTTGETQGASITVDGRGYVVEGHEDGFFVGPTVIDNVTTDMDVYQQEIFGPVLSVVRVDDVETPSR